MTQRKKIGIISIYNPHLDKTAHSGILFKINQSLENAGHETIWIQNPKSKIYNILGKLIVVLNFFFKKQIYLDRTSVGSYLLASTVDRKEIEKVDYIVIIHYFHVIYWLRTNKPIIYHSDATFELVNNYYFHNMFDWNQRQAEHIEKVVLEKAHWHLSSSNWRNCSVIDHYKIDKSKCRVLEYGPCLNGEQVSKIAPTKDTVIKLLFFGVDWNRKGGAIAVDACNKLNENGFIAELIILGIKEIPDYCKGNKNINFVGYLNKNESEQYHKIIRILNESDFLILPSKAECAGIVFSESAFFGIPILTYDTGGISNYVINNYNGFRLPLSSDAEDYANKIKEIIINGKFDYLSSSGITLAHSRLNWDRWTEEFKIICK